MTTIINCSAATINMAGTEWIATLLVKEKTKNGFKKLYKKQSPKKFAFTNRQEAKDYAVKMAEDIKLMSSGVDIIICA